MPIFIYPQPGGNPILGFLVSVAVLAVSVGLAIFFLPIIGMIVLTLVVLGLVFWGWSWFKRQVGGESPDERGFRETMERAEAQARTRYGADGTRRLRRRDMTDVEDIEEIR